MAIRVTMQALVDELRGYTDAQLNEAVVNSISYWTDEQLLAVLDRYATEHIDLPLIQQPLYYSGAYEYRRYLLPSSIPTWTEAGIEFEVVDNLGNVADPLDYTTDFNRSVITFNVDQKSFTWYIRAVSYDMWSAAADVWGQKAAHRTALIEWKAGAGTMKEQQEFQHCMEMQKFYKKKAGIKSVATKRVGYFRHGQNRWSD